MASSDHRKKATDPRGRVDLGLLASLRREANQAKGGASILTQRAIASAKGLGSTIGTEFGKDVQAAKDLYRGSKSILGGDADEGVERFNP